MKLFLFDFHKLVYYFEYEKPVVLHNRTYPTVGDVS